MRDDHSRGTSDDDGERRAKRGTVKYVDKLAAVYILQGYLDHEGMKREKDAARVI